MSDKLADAVKEVDKATKQLRKEQQEWKAIKGSLQRDKIKLTAELKKLKADKEVLETDKQSLSESIDILRLNKQSLEEKNTQLERENATYEDNLEALKTELATVTDDLTTKKANLDTELEEYAKVRKQEIKDSILKANDELVALLTEIKERNTELEARKTELRELNQIYLDEQTAIKVSNADTERLLAENREKVAEIQQEIQELEDKLQKVGFEYNNVLISMTKAKEEHAKFVEYEVSARKILENTDRELQQRQANIAEESQFLKNRRSFLPEL